MKSTEDIIIFSGFVFIFLGFIFFLILMIIRLFIKESNYKRIGNGWHDNSRNPRIFETYELFKSRSQRKYDKYYFLKYFWKIGWIWAICSAVALGILFLVLRDR